MTSPITMQLPTMNQEQMQELEQVESMADVAFSKLNITSMQQCNEAGDMAKQLYAMQKKLDETRKTLTRPLDDAKKRIKAFFDEPIDKLIKAQMALKGAATVFISTAKADAELNGLDPATIKPTGFNVRTTWTFEVIDITKIPAEYLLVDEKKIQAVVIAMGKTGAVIPGINAYQRESIAIGRSDG